MKVVAFPAKRASSQVDVLPGGHSRGARRRTRKDTLAAESDLYPLGFTASFWFDSESGNRPATIRFSGRRVGQRDGWGVGTASSRTRWSRGSFLAPARFPFPLTYTTSTLGSGR
jgi:hypothetical protein